MPTTVETTNWIQMLNAGGTGLTILVLLSGYYIIGKWIPKVINAMTKLAVQMERQNDLCEKMIEREKERNRQ